MLSQWMVMDVDGCRYLVDRDLCKSSGFSPVRPDVWHGRYVLALGPTYNSPDVCEAMIISLDKIYRYILSWLYPKHGGSDHM